MWVSIRKPPLAPTYRGSPAALKGEKIYFYKLNQKKHEKSY